MNNDNVEKKTFAPPVLKEYGNLAEITNNRHDEHGWAWGYKKDHHHHDDHFRFDRDSDAS